MARIALCVIATGRYHHYLPGLCRSAELFFLPRHTTTLVVFSEAPPPCGDVWHKAAGRPWPGPTLYRYHDILSAAGELNRHDYIFYVDVDCLFVSPVGDEVLGGLVATVHQGFAPKPRHRWLMPLLCTPLQWKTIFSLL